MGVAHYKKAFFADKNAAAAAAASHIICVQYCEVLDLAENKYYLITTGMMHWVITTSTWSTSGSSAERPTLIEKMSTSLHWITFCIDPKKNIRRVNNYILEARYGPPLLGLA